MSWGFGMYSLPGGSRRKKKRKIKLASKTYRFRGKAMWCKCHTPDTKYDRYVVDAYLDEPSFRLFKASGLQLEIRDGDEGKYVKFARPTSKIIKKELVKFDPVEVVDENGNKIGPDTLIGNGSVVAFDVVVYDTVKGKGHRWDRLIVKELNEYNQIIEADDLPVEEEAPKETKTTNKKGRTVEVDDDEIPF